MHNRFCKNDNVVLVNKDELQYIQFKNLKKYDNIITHCFTTRSGGVSEEECSTLNLGFNRRDKMENVLENYIRLSQALSLDYRNMVFSNQVHENKIKAVTASDRGKGITVKSDIIGYDGLITNESGVVLVTFYADCVPIFLFDPAKKVIGLVHSGWRGTVKKIAYEAVHKMHEEYGCNPGDIIAAIGPSIGDCCFEVGSEVYEEFRKVLPWSVDSCFKTGDEKWNISLSQIIKQTLVKSGVFEDNICISGICTKCNNDVFFSHRGDKGKTGSLAAVMQIDAL